MVLWLVFGSIFLVWNVFQSPGLDFRLIAIGALLPLVLDAPLRRMAYAHTLLSAVLVLVLAMAFTAGRGHRLRRRRALSLAIGWFTSLVLSGAWMHKDVFWWPASGSTIPHVALLAAWPVLLIEEVLGIAAAWWTWSRFGLADPVRRTAFWRSGRLDIVGEQDDVIDFVRHGQTAHNRDGLLQGRVDLELSDRGLAQAERVASRYAGAAIARVVSSPLRRARQTAAAIAAVIGCEVEIDDRLLELDYGEWDGRPLAEIRPERWAAWRADPNFAPPGGESLVAVTERVAEFCRERLTSDERIVAVSHVSPIKAAVAWALGVSETVTFRMQLGLASITTVGARADGAGYLLSFNDSAHLARE